MEEENSARAETSTLGSLVSGLTNEMTSLVRNEVELAKAEASEKAAQAGKGAASLGIAGAVLFSGFLVLLAAAVYALDAVIGYGTTPWLSALIVGGIVLVIGLIMLQAGRKKLKTLNLTPDRTAASFRNDRELARQHDEKVKEEMK